jgi:hypothetical protein
MRPARVPFVLFYVPPAGRAPAGTARVMAVSPGAGMYGLFVKPLRVP